MILGAGISAATYSIRSSSHRYAADTLVFALGGGGACSIGRGLLFSSDGSRSGGGELRPVNAQ